MHCPEILTAGKRPLVSPTLPPGGSPPATPPPDSQRFGPHLATLLDSFSALTTPDAPVGIRRGLQGILAARDLLQEGTHTSDAVLHELNRASLLLVTTTEQHIDELSPRYSVIIPGALYAIARLDAINGADISATRTMNGMLAHALVLAAITYLQAAPIDPRAVDGMQQRSFLTTTFFHAMDAVERHTFSVAQQRVIGGLLAHMGIASACRSWDWGVASDLSNLAGAARVFFTPEERTAFASLDFTSPAYYFSLARDWRNAGMLGVVEHVLAVLLDQQISDDRQRMELAMAIVHAARAENPTNPDLIALYDVIDTAHRTQQRPVTIAYRVVDLYRRHVADAIQPAMNLVDFVHEARTPMPLHS